MKSKLSIGLLVISLCAGLTYAADYSDNMRIDQLDNIGTGVTKDVYVLVQDPVDPTKIGRATLSELTDRGLYTRGMFPDGTVYLNGDSENPIDGDLRFREIDGISSFEIYDIDVAEWIPAPAKVGRGSLSAGPQISIGEAGSMIVFRLAKDTGRFYFPPVTGLDNTGRTLPVSIFEPEDGEAVTTVDIRTGNTTDMPATDVSGTYTLGYTTIVTDNFLIWAHTVYCGATNPTENITYKVYEATDSTDESKLLVEKIFPASTFSGKSPGDAVKLEIRSDGTFQPILGTTGENYFVEFTSSAPFSYYGNGSLPDISLDLQVVSLRYMQYANTLKVTASRTVNTGDYIMVDTSGGAVTLTAMAGAISFNIEDFDESFGSPNDCTVVVGAHSAVLNKKKGRYRFFKDGSDWWYQDLRSGKTTEVASVHYADVDFKVTPLYNAFREAATYNTGDCVVYDGCLFYALQDSITGPWVSGEWREVGVIPDDAVTSVNTQTGVVVLDQDDIGDGTTYKQFSATEKTNLGNQSGTNTGDQDVSGLALKANVLELDNTDSFTPDADYEPATKKYVDDNSGGGTLPSLTYSGSSHLDNYDVTSIAPTGILFMSNTSNVELKSLKDGVNKQIIFMVKTNANDVKIKDTTGAGQEFLLPGGSDTNINSYGGATLICDGTNWYVSSVQE